MSAYWRRTKCNNKSVENRINAVYTFLLRLFFSVALLLRFPDEKFLNLLSGKMGFSLNMFRVHIVFNFHALKADLAKTTKEEWKKSLFFCPKGSRVSSVIFRWKSQFSAWHPHYPCILQPQQCTPINFILSFFSWSRIFNEIFNLMTNINVTSNLGSSCIHYYYLRSRRQRFITHVCQFFCSFLFGVCSMQISPINQSFRLWQREGESNLLNSLWGNRLTIGKKPFWCHWSDINVFVSSERWSHGHTVTEAVFSMYLPEIATGVVFWN